MVLPFSLKAQTVTFLNPFRIPITDLEKYPPCYFSIEIDELMSKEIRVYTLDSLLDYESVLNKDADGKEIRKIEKQYYNINRNLQYDKDSDLVLNRSLVENYHENGFLKLRELWNGETVEEGYYFDKSGNSIEKPIEISPEPFDGMIGWNKYLQKSLKFPKDARKQRIEGTVYTVFELTEEGKIENLEIMNPEQVHESLGNEALRVIAAYPYTWIPGKVDGENVRVRMRLPISFRQ
jgi:TonB family protein